MTLSSKRLLLHHVAMLCSAGLSLVTVGCVSQVPSTVARTCLRFEQPLVLGTVYGRPAGQAPGALAFNAQGVPVSVQKFVSVTGGSAFNLARIDAAVLGSGQTVRTNNINLEFDFTGLGFVVSKIEFEFLDLGGFENIALNGGPIFAGEISAAPPVLNGVSIAVTSTPVRGGKKGEVILKGAIRKLWIGGQEFWVDNLCVIR